MDTVADSDGLDAGEAGQRPASQRSVTTVFGVVAVLWVVMDQATKLLATRVFATDPVDLGWVRLVDVRNTNAAFGIPGFPGLFLGVTVVVVALVVRTLPQADSLSLGVAYGMIVGGAIGNGIDRVFRAPGFPGGGVVDFIDLGWWPVFNIADIGITCGAALLVWLLWRAEQRDTGPS